MPKRLTDEIFQDRLVELREQGQDVYSDDKYINSKTKMVFYCSNGHRWPAKPGNILWEKSGCPYCCGRVAPKDENSLASLRPDLLQYFVKPECAYVVSEYSNQRVDLKCPDCGYTKKMFIHNLSRHGFGCPVCGGCVSYPNRLIRSLMRQLESAFDDLRYEWSDTWTNKQRYDVYFEIKHKKYVIEMQGRQHYEDSWYCDIPIKDIIAYDKAKADNAMFHDITPIIIDASISDFDFIFQNINNSALATVVDLSALDLKKCREDATKNIVKQVCSLYDAEKLKLVELAAIFRVHKDTIKHYLKIGNKLGWCSYMPKTCRSQTPIIVCDINGACVINSASASSCAKELSVKYDAKFYPTNIFRAIESGKPYHDLLFKFIVQN